MHFPAIAAALAALALTGCGSFVASAGADMAQNLSTAIQNQSDPQLVEEGLPSYMLLMDAMVAQSPNNASLKMASAKLYSAYGGTFTEDPTRAKAMTQKAFDLATSATCLTAKTLCTLTTTPYPTFKKTLEAEGADHIKTLYDLGTVWAGYIRTHSGDWNAVADVPKVKAIMTLAASQNPTMDHGGPDLYLGVLESLVPPASGGKPEVARQHFEKAIALSDGRNLMAKTLFAEYNARSTFNRTLHDELLHSVLDANPEAPGMTLMNTLAQKRAKALLESADSFF